MDNLKIAQKISCYILENIDRVCRKNGIEYFIVGGTLLGAKRHGGFIPWDDDIDIAMTRENYNRFLKIAQKELGDEFFVQTPETDKNYNIFHQELRVRHNYSKVIEKKESKCHQGVFVDVLVIDYIPNNFILRTIQRNLSLIISSADIVCNVPFKGLSLKNKILYPIYWLLSKKTSFKTRRKIALSLRALTGNNNNLMSYGLDSIWKTVFTKEDIYPIKEIMFESLKVMAPNNIESVLTKEYGDYMKLPPEEDRVPRHFIGVEVFDKRRVI